MKYKLCFDKDYTCIIARKVNYEMMIKDNKNLKKKFKVGEIYVFQGGWAFRVSIRKSYLKQYQGGK